MSPHFLKDMLGEDGWVLLDRVVKTHKKSLRRDKDKLDRIQKASIYFDEKMLLRRELPLKRMEQSITGHFVKRTYQWREAYKEIM